MSFNLPKEFFKIVVNDELQNQELRLPKKYVENYWKGIPNPVILRLPNGAEKEIFWVERDNDIWFQKKWDQFAKFLKYGYLLTFKYIGGSYFKVKIFDSNTLEIDYSNIKFVDDNATKNLDAQINIASTSQRRKSGKRKISCSNKGGMIKEAKKYPTINGNPSFKLKMSPSYAQGNVLRIPSEFSREYLNKFEGTACIRVGDNVPMKVKVNYSGTCIMTKGWKLFTQKNNLQVGAIYKFEMTQLQPPSFTITIAKTRGYEGMISSDDDNIGKRRGIKGASRSCHVLLNLEGCSEMKPNTFKIQVNSSYPYIENEFFKRHREYHGKLVELKKGGKSWFVKVQYYERSCRFYAGWRKFKKDCELKIGDICLLELIDEEKLVFEVSIERVHHH